MGICWSLVPTPKDLFQNDPDTVQLVSFRDSIESCYPLQNHSQPQLAETGKICGRAALCADITPM